MTVLLDEAIEANVRWCDLVCRTHGVEAAVDRHAWASSVRTPPLHPDAITIVPDAPVRALLARIDLSPGCSVKDSFATLDLGPFGFRVLFEAQWIARAPDAAPPGDAAQWDTVDASSFGAWERAGRAAGASGVLRAQLADRPEVRLVGHRVDGRFRAGATTNRAASAVGVGNVFPVELPDTWRGLVAAAHRAFPGLALTGYESGGALDAACAAGFEPLGPLRVWVRDP